MGSTTMSILVHDSWKDGRGGRKKSVKRNSFLFFSPRDWIHAHPQL